MSTRNKQRAKKAVLLLLGVSSVATLGLIVSQGQVGQNDNLDDNALDPDKTSNFDGEAKMYVATMNDMEYKLQNNIEKNNIEESNAPPPEEETASVDRIAMSQIANINDYEKVKVLATGYTAGIESTGKEPSHPEYGITYSGTRVRRDVYSTIAADLNVFPLGTILYIPDYGFGVVADIGSAINGQEIDLYFETVDEVYNSWGKKYVEVYVIKRGDGKINDSLLDYYNKVAMGNTIM